MREILNEFTINQKYSRFIQMKNLLVLNIS